MIEKVSNYGSYQWACRAYKEYLKIIPQYANGENNDYTIVALLKNTQTSLRKFLKEMDAVESEIKEAPQSWEEIQEDLEEYASGINIQIEPKELRRDALELLSQYLFDCQRKSDILKVPTDLIKKFTTIEGKNSRKIVKILKRLNNTDISIIEKNVEDFRKRGKNIISLFEEIQSYHHQLDELDPEMYRKINEKSFPNFESQKLLLCNYFYPEYKEKSADTSFQM